MINLDEILQNEYNKYGQSPYFGIGATKISKAAMREAIRQALELAANEAIAYEGVDGCPEVSKGSITSLINKVV